MFASEWPIVKHKKYFELTSFVYHVWNKFLPLSENFKLSFESLSKKKKSDGS